MILTVRSTPQLCSLTGDPRSTSWPRPVVRTRSSSRPTRDIDVAVKDSCSPPLDTLVKSAVPPVWPSWSVDLRDPVFFRQLGDAVESLRVGLRVGNSPLPWDRLSVKPNRPSNERSHLDPGETWLVTPSSTRRGGPFVESRRQNRRASRFVEPPARMVRSRVGGHGRSGFCYGDRVAELDRLGLTAVLHLLDEAECQLD